MKRFGQIVLFVVGFTLFLGFKLIPPYLESVKVKSALDSLARQQTARPFEVLVVENGVRGRETESLVAQPAAPGVEMRYPVGHDHRPGPTTAWMRTVPLLPHEELSGFARICPLADCGNAISRNAEPGPIGFVNTDLTVVLHREPAGDWFGMQSVSHWQSDGFGMSDSLLFDDRGPVGRALQSLIVQTR